MITVPPAAAQIIYVDTDAPGGGNGQSWAAAYQFLQDALDVAVSGNEIRVAEGTYQPDRDVVNPGGTGERTATFQLISGVTIKGGYAGSGAGDPDARDIDSYPTILSGDLKANDQTDGDTSDLLNEPNRMENSYHVVTGNFTDPNAALDGFVVRGGQADGGGWPHDNGAGMYNDVGKPTLINCTFLANAARYNGGGMFNYSFSSPNLTNCTFSGNYAQNGAGMNNNLNSSPTLIQSTFKDNYAQDKGGALRNQSQSNATITNSIFSGNDAQSGGGIYNQNCNPILVNCTFCGNRAPAGGGMYNYYSSPVITNSIFWGDTPDEIHVHSGTPTVTYCNVQGGWPGWGNLNINPLFAKRYLDNNNTPTDPNDDFYVITDYHLQSQAGRWDPNQGLWIFDPNTSRAIDAGHPGYPLGDEPAGPDNLRINMGAYGGADQAGKTPPGWALLADMTNDGIVNLADYTCQAQDWEKSNDKRPGDLNRDGMVDIFDLALLSADWLKCTIWH